MLIPLQLLLLLHLLIFPLNSKCAILCLIRYLHLSAYATTNGSFPCCRSNNLLDFFPFRFVFFILLALSTNNLLKFFEPDFVIPNRLSLPPLESSLHVNPRYFEKMICT